MLDCWSEGLGFESVCWCLLRILISWGIFYFLFWKILSLMRNPVLMSNLKWPWRYQGVLLSCFCTNSDNLNGDSVILHVFSYFSTKPDHSVVQNDIHPMSKNGELLSDMFNNYNMKLLNTSKSCIGTFTWIDEYRQEIDKSVMSMFLFHLILNNILFQCTLMNQLILVLNISLNVVRDILTTVL